jgi:hypothetical protein
MKDAQVLTHIHPHPPLFIPVYSQRRSGVHRPYRSGYSSPFARKRGYLCAPCWLTHWADVASTSEPITVRSSPCPGYANGPFRQLTVRGFHPSRSAALSAAPPTYLTGAPLPGASESSAVLAPSRHSNYRPNCFSMYVWSTPAATSPALEPTSIKNFVNFCFAVSRPGLWALVSSNSCTDDANSRASFPAYSLMSSKSC